MKNLLKELSECFDDYRPSAPIRHPESDVWFYSIRGQCSKLYDSEKKAKAAFNKICLRTHEEALLCAFQEVLYQPTGTPDLAKTAVEKAIRVYFENAILPKEKDDAR